jgi:hypothetical protein
MGYLSQFFILKGKHSGVFGVQLHFDGGKGVGGGEVAMGIPHGLGGLGLVSLILLAALHLHGAVDDAIWRQRFQPFHFLDDNLENKNHYCLILLV